MKKEKPNWLCRIGLHKWKFIKNEKRYVAGDLCKINDKG